jgi:hypothetical protein
MLISPRSPAWPPLATQTPSTSQPGVVLLGYAQGIVSEVSTSPLFIAPFSRGRTGSQEEGKPAPPREHFVSTVVSLVNRPDIASPDAIAKLFLTMYAHRPCQCPLPCSQLSSHITPGDSSEICSLDMCSQRASDPVHSSANIFASSTDPALRSQAIVNGMAPGVGRIPSPMQSNDKTETRITVAGSPGRFPVRDRYDSGWYEILYDGLAVTSGPDLVSCTMHRLNAGDGVEVVSVTQVGSRTRGFVHVAVPNVSDANLERTEVSGWISLAAKHSGWVWAKTIDRPAVTSVRSSYSPRAVNHSKSVENRVSLRVLQSSRLGADVFAL